MDLRQVSNALAKSHGIDLFVGRKTHQMFRAAGLINVQVNPVIHVYPPGSNRRNILADFLENVRDRVLLEGLMEEGEFGERLTELKRHLDDPNTLVISHLYLQVGDEERIDGPLGCTIDVGPQPRLQPPNAAAKRMIVTS